jgi:hypothetical protein
MRIVALILAIFALKIEMWYVLVRNLQFITERRRRYVFKPTFSISNASGYDVPGSEPKATGRWRQVMTSNGSTISFFQLIWGSAFNGV